MKEAKEVKIKLSKRKVMLTILLVFVIILIVLTYLLCYTFKKRNRCKYEISKCLFH